MTYFLLLQIIVGDGKNCDDFVYVENVVHAHICAEKTLSTKDGAKRSGGKVCTFIAEQEKCDSPYYSHDIFNFL